MLPCLKKSSEIICLVYKKFQKPEKFNLKFIFDVEIQETRHYGQHMTNSARLTT